ncbi:MAG: sodium-extruding oxaloacetate decarboxylase subunit alpha [Spirochaetes bacterium]|nr:sodium-extruding oxaloacetate decarboxylase subunit alpha [Spirochaetota bacterium]HNV43260.1 sodium-extruding oxaloacetate decarboxylase subunit alpha [Exilispira sp.]MBP8990735.1 sodium-extruding oxaloacetate decarboxylase subunit alpha [Spirochaetota bacterium]HOV45703.1 sodium-extruding oxaloacetate decarboxylase subunit alpha [Exilispira sp.]HPB47704.1 sodium-extruding oxaloacetate decarboxylase subunit alpha [Exilispira sp.]
MKKIMITDVTLRDAHQSLIATRMKTEDMIPILDKMDSAGFFSMEVWGGATFDTCIRYLNEDPWQRLKQLKAMLPKTPLQMLLRGQNLVGYRHYADDIVENFVFKAAEYGIDIFRIFDALNDTRNLAKAIESVKKVGKHAQGAISYTISPVHTLESYIQLAKDLKNMGVDSICIKDMAGLLLPEETYELVKGIKEAVNLPLVLHSHSTSGVSVATLLKGIEAGADIMDTAISSFSMQTSHSATESIVASLQNTDYDTELDLELLDEIATYFASVREKYREFETNIIIDTKIFLYQVPGGMLSNLESQLKQQNAYDKMTDVLREIPQVRKDFGYPPLVTPTSQIVGTQAVMNVIAGERYKTLTNESKNLLIGNYGKTPAEPDQELVKRALKELNLEKPVVMRPADLLHPELDLMIEKTKEIQKKNKVSMEDVLTYALFPNIAPAFFKQRANPVPEEKVEKTNKDTTKTNDMKAYLVNVEGHEFKIIFKEVSLSDLSISSMDLKFAKPTGSNNNETSMQSSSEKKEVEVVKEAKVEENKIEQKECKERIVSPVTGTVLKVLKKDDEEVKPGEVILTLEAMKVEFEIKAQTAGKVKVKVSHGDIVQSEAILCEIY